MSPQAQQLSIFHDIIVVVVVVVAVLSAFFVLVLVLAGFVTYAEIL